MAPNVLISGEIPSPRSKLTKHASAPEKRSWFIVLCFTGRNRRRSEEGVMVVGGLVFIAANMANVDPETYSAFEANYLYYQAVQQSGLGDLSDVQNDLLINVRDIFGDIPANVLSGKF